MIDPTLKTFTEQNIRPLKTQRDRITRLYGEIQSFLGEGNCFQTGSYARFTSTRPVHDLDIFYVYKDGVTTAGAESALPDLAQIIESEFPRHCSETFEVDPQTHSIKLTFEDQFTVDIVPAVELQTKSPDYQDPIYVVPVEASGEWIFSDPKGYKNLTRETDDWSEKKLRYAIRLVKAWRKACKDRDDEFKLKSFHVEQIFIELFREDPSKSIYDAVLEFYGSVPENLLSPRFEDRAYVYVGERRYIDAYVDDLTQAERENVKRLARVQFDLYSGMKTGGTWAQPHEIETILRRSMQCPAPAAGAQRASPTVFAPAGPHQIKS